MALKAVLFDLDGTLLPMDQDLFVKSYFKGLAAKLAPLGYDPEKLINVVWSGTYSMINNSGEKTNEEIFWDLFVKEYGESAKKDLPYFDEFYKNEFQNIKEITKQNETAKSLVEKLKSKNIRIALATNPLFPSIATESRIKWAGFSPCDFEIYTTYENINYSKPNLKYYSEILSRLGLKAEECIMVGNDVDDDMVAKNLGMKVFLITDFLINKNNTDISVFPNGSFRELDSYIKSLL